MAKRVTCCEGRITGIASEEGGDPALPLIVCVPGGGSSAVAFDLPHQSFLGSAACNGFAAIALNRPAQMDSAPLALDPTAEEGAFAANASMLLQAIDEVQTSRSSGGGSVFLYGSSIGGAIALHMAARCSEFPRPWKLCGLSVADIGQLAPPQIVDAWHALPVTDIINLAAYLPLFAASAPPWSLPMRPPGPPEALRLPVPRAELQEIVGAWPRRWREVCGAIRVPVQYALAEHDAPWHVSEALVAEFAATLRRSSAHVEAKIMKGASHGIALGPLGRAHVLEVLGFAARCAVAERIPAIHGASKQ